MEDKHIVELFWSRDERAIRETDSRYGRYLWTIAFHVLADREDSDECVNDTYYKAWEAMPPHRPSLLSPFLGRITRHLAVDRYRRRAAQKRVASEYTLSLDELAECVSGSEDPAAAAELELLTSAVSVFLREQSAETRQVFLWRYYFLDSIADIAARLGESVPQVKSLLYRTRVKLRAHLEKEGFTV